MLRKHKEDCLSINGVQSVKVEEGKVEFKNYFKQIPVQFKIYADFEDNFRDVEIYEGSCSKKKIKITPVAFFLTKLFVLMIDLVNRLLLLEVKMLLMNLLKQFLKTTITAKR